MRSSIQFIADYIEKKPWYAYIGAIVPTSAGFGVLFEKLTALFGLLSMVAGFCVAAVTIYIQVLQIRKLRREAKINEPKT